MLFILYIDNVLRLHQDLIAYADDTAVPINGSTWAELACKTSVKLNKIYSWLYKNQLILNIKKSVFITFGNYTDSVPENIEIKMNGQKLERVNCSKYLGLIYDFNMKWDLHVNSIVKRTKYLVYVFYRLKNVLTKNQMLQIYYGLFHSIAAYGVIGWGGLYQCHYEKLERIQNRILKIIGIETEDKNRPLNIKQVFVLNAIVRLYKELKNEFNTAVYDTRFKSVSVPRYALTIGQRSYEYYAKKYFNEIPNYLKNLNVNQKVLKNKLKEVIKVFKID